MALRMTSAIAAPAAAAALGLAGCHGAEVVVDSATHNPTIVRGVEEGVKAATGGKAIARDLGTAGSHDGPDRREAETLIDLAREHGPELIREGSREADHLMKQHEQSAADPAPPRQPAPISDAVFHEILAQHANGATRR
ncbi:MAG: hypothetical protein QOJ53_2403 [Sphingomonadales bacterium]|nr:hypothetical protein [Sphingomonadales bacterium]MEA3045175.1 hypothetical protein [Sphingomonadales bacterium]MEA3048071.1 hypothetical protein [Sphingomonadales bacterium]